MDAQQNHRLLIDSFEKSRLNTLLFIGDSYEFNDHRLQYIAPSVYEITSLKTNASVQFSIGKYDNIQLHSYLNFYAPATGKYKEIDSLDYMASAFAVKYMLKQISLLGKPQKDVPLFLNFETYEWLREQLEGTHLFGAVERLYLRGRGHYYQKPYITAQEDMLIREALDAAGYKYSESFSNLKRVASYENFVNQLRSYGTPEQIFNVVHEFVSINFTITPEFNVNSHWVNPHDLLYTKKLIINLLLFSIITLLLN